MDRVLSLTQQRAWFDPNVGSEKEERDSSEHSLLFVKTLLVWGGRPVGQFTHGGPASQKLPWQ